MKKYIKAIPILVSAILITSCATNKTELKDLKFPTLQPCTINMIDSDKSFICTRKMDGPDSIETYIRFSTDSFSLNEQGKTVLDELYAYLALTHTNDFVIRGYAGKIDSKLITHKKLLTDHNIRLSKNRAITVRDYLVNKGIDPDGISIKALGYQDPVAANDTAADRDKNQRVEISVKSETLDKMDSISKKMKSVNTKFYKKFFSNVYLLDQNQYDNVGKIFDSAEKRPLLANNFKVFVNKDYHIKNKDDHFIIFSEPQEINSSYEDRKVFMLGTAKYDYTYKGTTALTIDNLIRETTVGDYAAPIEMVSREMPEKTFSMKIRVTANVLEDVMNTNTFSSSYNSVIINRGTEDGLQLGAEMILYNPETREDGYPVPPEYLGYGFVYRASEHFSIVLIVSSLKEITKNSMATTVLS